MQKCMELFKDSFNKNALETPSASKRSKSVSNPEKAEKNSVNEAMLELKKLKEKVPRRFYVKAAMALADKEIRKLNIFNVCFDCLVCYRRTVAILNMPRNSNFTRYDSSSNDDEIVVRQRWFFLLMDCIGAIDGTHVAAYIPRENRVPYFDRNAEITQNILAACSHDMMFTYVMTGWRVRHMIQEYFPKLLHWSNFQRHVVVSVC
ncbi:hypothetical protein CRG98_006946 [Punica granatum]|uniref:DDE Tnp4 domain-containing protein n=1 Tax=Punica granatum TaxID=22663 RepID=A0A2I0KVS8_PUNGR|nr:hypothetical protein CRG98_006946 [Punica granatum]